MSVRSLSIFGVVTGVIIVAAIVAVDTRPQYKPENKFPPLFENIADFLKNDLSAVEIQNSDGSFTVAKSDDGEWGIREKLGYPADMDKLNTIIRGFDQMEVLEKKTANPDYFKKLGVKKVGEDNSTVKVTLFDKQNQPVYSLLVGNSNWKNNDRCVYVRKDGENQAWLVKSDISGAGDAKSWLKQDLLDIDADRMRGVKISRPDGEVVDIEKDSSDAKDYVLAGVPKGRKIKSAGTLRQIAETPRSLTLEDVFPVDAPPAELSKTACLSVSAVFTTFDGLAVTASLTKTPGNAYYANFSATFDDAFRLKESENAGGGADDDKGEKKKRELKPADEVKKEAAEINGRLSKWLFKLSDWKGRNLFKNINDLTTEEKKPPAKTTKK